jgi:hypothetical protein
MYSKRAIHHEMECRMSNQPSDQPRSTLATVVGAIVLAAILLGGYVLIQRGGGSPTAQVSSSSSATPDTSWPTTGPTFTPQPSATPHATATAQPTATALPTATPLPTAIPIVINKQQVGELAVMVVTVSSIQTIRGEDAKLFGIPVPLTSESITVEYVVRVKLGVKYDQIQYRPNGQSVSVNVPAIEILSIEPVWDKSKIVGTDQRFIGSNLTEMQKKAWEAAHEKIKQRVLGDTELLAQAQMFIELILKDNLRNLGFTTVSIL